MGLDLVGDWRIWAKTVMSRGGAAEKALMHVSSMPA